ncbi:MAG: cytochrome c biogenesis protein CcsA [Candidatus Omnitrophica bacterium]|nr:cytochrome c biogenesis protein CcsA [Candidatus Omnitrophota bacterium]
MALDSWQTHGLTALLGYSAFLTAALLAFTYLWVVFRLKRKDPDIFQNRTPALETLDRVHSGALLLGWILLTLGLAQGLLLASKNWETWAWGDPKTVAALATWAVYAGALVERFLLGGRRGRVALMSLVGFACLLFTFVGVNYWLPGRHTFF